MKIKKYEIKDGMLRVETDGKGRNVFVYKADKFSSKAALIKEIEKSLRISDKKEKIKKEKKEKLENDLKNGGN